MKQKEKKSGKKIIVRILSGIGVALLIIVVAVLLLFRNELRTLLSFEKVDDYGMYQMTYYGDYGFDEFLKTGASSDTDIESFVTTRILKGLPINLGITEAGCTAFAVQNENGDILYGRNFDFDYAPSVQLYTTPDNGYASVSTVNLAFAGYTKDNLPDATFWNRFLTLAAPFLCVDGMNEKGVAMALLAVPEAEAPYDSDKVTLNTTTAIRLVLDKAATVEEAIELLKQYNIYFSQGVECHYLLADASGHSVIVEYYDGDLQVVETDQNYQIASNFIAYHDVNIGEGYSEFERYDQVQETIEANEGRLNAEQAVQLLADIGIPNRIQWSVLYNLTTGCGEIFAHRNTENIVEFSLDMDE